MDDGTPTLEVGFAMETGGAFAELMRFADFFDDKTMQIVRQVAAVEKATGGMMQVGAATARISSFSAASTRELANVRREKVRTEKVGERLIAQLEREAFAMGKSRDQMRDAKVAATALAAAQQGNTDLAARLHAATRQRTFAAEAAAEAEQRAAAQAVAARQSEAAAIARAAREHDQLAAAVRESHAAQIADASAADRLRMATDPLYAATSRLNAEIAESTRLYYAGATAPAEYARQQEVLTGRLRDVEQQHAVVNRGIGAAGTTGKLTGYHMQNLAFQFQDVGIQMAAAANSSQPFKMAMMAVLQQGAQIQMIMSQSGVGIRAVGAAFVDMSKKILITAATNPYLLAIGATIGLFAGAVKALQNAANSGTDMKEYAKSLGLTTKEIRNLDNVTVTFGDTAKAVFQVTGRTIWEEIGPAVTSSWDVMKEWTAWIFSGVKSAANFLIGAFVGGYHAIVATWRMFPAAMGDLFTQAVNKAITGINWLIRKSVSGINWMVDQANKILPAFAQLDHIAGGAIAGVTSQWDGAASQVADVWRDKVGGAMKTDYIGEFAASAGGAIIDQAAKNARDRLRKQAEEKGYLDPEKGKTPKTDKLAEKLARENAAIEAQIRNLYALADAYKISGAEALIAEARVKAESDAIKKRGDIEMFVDRQIRLEIAQRVSDAAKASAGVRDQAAAQEAMNAMVKAGTVPAERAAELVKDQIADLPLLAAVQVAQQRGLAEEATRATGALADQRAERERLRKAEETAQFNQDISSGADRLAELREEVRLIGAGNMERVRALAILKATQEAETKFSDPAQRAQYIAQQRDIALATQSLADAQRDLNDALSFTADKWDLIGQNIQIAGQGMADAFGGVGRALGDLAGIYAGFHAVRARLDAEHQKKLLEVKGDAAATARAEQLYALRTATLQVGAYGDMISAAKGFFNEKSKGYKALMTAEKVFRAVEFALSVRAMAQDAIETGASLAKSAARTAAHAVEAVAKAIASLPFPANLAAGAATIAALAAIGVSIAGSFGGSGNNPPPSNTGTGTVLGDAAAQSASLKNSIDALREVDTTTSIFARQMSYSLKSIDSQIGNLAAVVVRAGNIDASAGVTEGFKKDFIGSVLSKIPLIGGILGSLFGSKTTVTGSGLFGAPQSVGSILGSGFNASYYSDIEKKKKFFGITVGTSRWTQYTNADPALESQFTLILRSFADAISSAAGPLGEATATIQSRLNSFVVNIGRIDLKGLTGEQIQERLTAIFGAAADGMAKAAFPGISQFQKVGEGAFETLVRVAATIEAVTNTLDMLGQSAQDMSIAVKLGLADQFESIGAMNDAVASYFETYYSKEEQVAAKTAQLARVFESLGLTMPSSLATFRELVEAQDLTSAAGQAAYATLLKLAPAFAELQASMEGAKSAADILSERQNLERQLLELQGNTDALRQLELAKLDQSNRALQLQIWAIQDAKEAAKAADELRQAWQSVGDSIMDEVRRIRGLSDAGGGNSFASLMGQFNAATASARGGDLDAAKTLPQLSQALLAAAGDAATSRQELDRIRAQIAASLEATYGLVTSVAGEPQVPSNATLLNGAATSQPGTAAANDNGGAKLAAKMDELREEIAQLRADNNAGHAATGANTGSIKRTMDNITSQSGGDAIPTVGAAA